MSYNGKITIIENKPINMNDILNIIAETLGFISNNGKVAYSDLEILFNKSEWNFKEFKEYLYDKINSLRPEALVYFTNTIDLMESIYNINKTDMILDDNINPRKFINSQIEVYNKVFKLDGEYTEDMLFNLLEDAVCELTPHGVINCTMETKDHNAEKIDEDISMATIVCKLKDRNTERCIELINKNPELINTFIMSLIYSDTSLNNDNTCMTRASMLNTLVGICEDTKIDIDEYSIDLTKFIVKDSEVITKADMYAAIYLLMKDYEFRKNGR